MTPNDLIILAMKEAGALGVGQTASAEDMNDAFSRLNMMMAQWQRLRYLVYHLVDVAVPMTGQQSYTIGIGGDISRARPNKIVSAYFRQIQNSGTVQADYPLEILDAREDYNRIALKSMKSFPEYVFYDPAYPLGNVYVWPVPSPPGVYEVHLTVFEELRTFSSRFADFNLPDEYLEAILYNLALRLISMYKLPADQVVIGLAKSSLNILKQNNAKIPRLVLDGAVINRGGYNVYADRFK